MPVGYLVFLFGEFVLISYEELSQVFDLENPLTLEYFELCSVAYDGRGEKHHILPKSMFHNFRNYKKNIVMLTPRDHYKAHEMLAQICVDPISERKMKLSFWLLSHRKSNKEFLSIEAYAAMKEEYTITFSGEGNPRYGKKHSEETRRKQSEAQMGEKNYAFGTHISEERKKRQSEAQKGRKGKPATEETKDKLREINLGKKQSLETIAKKIKAITRYRYAQYDLDGQLLKVFESSQAVKDSGFDMSAVTAVCNGRYMTSKGFKWVKIAIETENG